MGQKKRKTSYRKSSKSKSVTPLVILIILTIIIASALLIRKQFEVQNKLENTKSSQVKTRPNQVISSNSNLKSNKGNLNDYIDAWNKVKVAPKSHPQKGTNSASIIATFGDDYTSSSKDSDLTTVIWNKHNNKYKIKMRFVFYLDHTVSKQLSGLYNNNPDLATKQNFNSLKNGMTENQVKQKVGSPNQISETYNNKSKKIEVDLYSNIKGENKNVSYSVVYQKGKVKRIDLGN